MRLFWVFLFASLHCVAPPKVAAETLAAPEVRILRPYVDDRGLPKLADINAQALQRAGHLLDAAGVSYIVEAMPWSRIQVVANERHNILIYGLKRSKVLEDKYHWIMPITSDLDMIIVAHADTAVLSPDDLKYGGKIACAATYWNCDTLIERGFPAAALLMLNDSPPTKPLELMAKGRAAAAVMYRPMLEEYAGRIGLALSDIRIVDAFKAPDFYLAAPETFSLALLERIRAAAATSGDKSGVSRPTE